ncbi:MAG: aldo/keto reductase, partial [Chloroflexota bacterium]
IPYSPLAGGFLTGKYRRNRQVHSARLGGVKRYFNERNWDLLERMDDMAKEKGATLSQVALAWLLADPLITSPIIGANSLDQLKDNLGALAISLSAEEKAVLDKATAWKAESED